MHIRTRKFLPKRDLEPAPLFELDSETMDWMRTHTVDDLANLAIKQSIEGKDATKATMLAAELTRLEWQTGTREDVSERLESMDYYTKAADQQICLGVV